VAVNYACKAQAYLIHVIRNMNPHEHMIPNNRMEDYLELKKKGLMQMGRLYNLLFGGRLTDHRVAGKLLQLYTTTF